MLEDGIKKKLTARLLLLAAVILRECLQVAVLFVGKWLFEQVDNPQQTFLTNGIIGSFFGFQAQNERLIII